MSTLNPDRTERLDGHAELLRLRDVGRAAAWVADSDPEAAELMRCAETAHGLLLWSTPDPDFRRRLGQLLREEARSSGSSQALEGASGRALTGRGMGALRRHRRRLLAGGGAAVAVIGVTLAVLLRDRHGVAETAGP